VLFREELASLHTLRIQKLDSLTGKCFEMIRGPARAGRRGESEESEATAAAGAGGVVTNKPVTCSLPSLHTLDLSNSSRLESEAVKTICTRVPTLTSLDLAGKNQPFLLLLLSLFALNYSDKS
jgi:hypothetical protein